MFNLNKVCRSPQIVEVDKTKRAKLYTKDLPIDMYE